VVAGLVLAAAARAFFQRLRETELGEFGVGYNALAPILDR
jgi:hypothetical protein